jgi:hypothetical protein
VLITIGVVVPAGVILPEVMKPFIITTLSSVTFVRLVLVILELVPVIVTLVSVELDTLELVSVLFVTVEVDRVELLSTVLVALELVRLLLVTEHPAPPTFEPSSVEPLRIHPVTRL